jgi:hypothetical protein
MNSTKHLILTLIQADLKHHQLISGLKSLHFETNNHFLDLHKPVAELMGLGEGTSEQWLPVYDHFLQQAGTYPMAGKADNLLPLATECYKVLQAYARIQSHVRLEGYRCRYQASGVQD